MFVKLSGLQLTRLAMTVTLTLPVDVQRYMLYTNTYTCVSCADVCQTQWAADQTGHDRDSPSGRPKVHVYIHIHSLYMCIMC